MPAPALLPLFASAAPAFAKLFGATGGASQFMTMLPQMGGGGGGFNPRAFLGLLGGPLSIASGPLGGFLGGKLFGGKPSFRKGHASKHAQQVAACEQYGLGHPVHCPMSWVSTQIGPTARPGLKSRREYAPGIARLEALAQRAAQPSYSYSAFRGLRL